MTVCVSVKVHDCLVFAADSASSIQIIDGAGRPAVINVYDHGNKMFNLYKGLPIAAMTAGIGNFGASSISTLTKDFRVLLSDPESEYYIDKKSYDLSDIAQKARRYFFEERFSTLADKPSGGFLYWIGGYSSGADLSELWKIEIRDGECAEPICEASREVSTITWGGQPEAISRLLMGYGSGLDQALVSAGLNPDNLDDMLNHILSHTQVGLVNAAMPTRDAIDLAIFLAETTKSFVRFMPGSNVVGGDIDVATVTKHEGFKWIRRKHFYDRTLNPLETDHA